MYDEDMHEEKATLADQIDTLPLGTEVEVTVSGTVVKGSESALPLLARGERYVRLANDRAVLDRGLEGEVRVAHLPADLSSYALEVRYRDGVTIRNWNAGDASSWFIALGGCYVRLDITDDLVRADIKAGDAKIIGIK